MKSEQFLRIVEEICILLKLPQPSIHKVIQLYKQMSQSSTHTYRNEIIIAACIFLVSKIDEHEHKIRDIVNVCYVVTSLYKVANRRREIEEGIEYLNIEFLKEELEDKNSGLWKDVIPDFPLDKFNSLKKDILEAEQHLLRIVRFEVDNARTRGYVLLLGYIRQFRLCNTLKDLVVKVYNDSIFTEVKESPKACLHFSIQLGLRSGVVMEHQVPGFMLDQKWWSEKMEVGEEELLDWGIAMLEYYKDM